MKPGNRQIIEMVPIHTKRIALIDERKVTVSAFLLMQKGFFFVHLESSHSNRNDTDDRT